MLGYLIGSLNPAALIGKMKKKNLRNSGTGNLGATNIMLTIGKRMGIFVMIFDIFKSFTIVKLAAWIAPNTPWISMCTGASAILGHCFPFYMKFRGGKGTAAFGGLVLAYNPMLFLFLMISGVVLILIINHAIALPMYAANFFAIYVAVREQNWNAILFAALCAALIVERNFSGLVKAIKKQDIPVRTYIKTKLFRNSNA